MLHYTASYFTMITSSKWQLSAPVTQTYQTSALVSHRRVGSTFTTWIKMDQMIKLVVAMPPKLMAIAAIVEQAS